MKTQSNLLGLLEETLALVGFDLVLSSGLEKIRVECEALGIALPRLNNPLGIFVGNTRAMWNPFLESLKSQPGLRQAEHPLDEWVEQRVTHAVSQLGPTASVYMGHRKLPRGFLPLQHWLQVLDLLALSPSHLSVHPDYGSWIALRAFVVIDVEAHDESSKRLAGEPCGSCKAPCWAPFERASEQSKQLHGTKRVTDHWQSWLAVREACPVGRHYRYGDDQIRYHYCRDRSVF